MRNFILSIFVYGSITNASLTVVAAFARPSISSLRPTSTSTSISQASNFRSRTSFISPSSSSLSALPESVVAISSAARHSLFPTSVTSPFGRIVRLSILFLSSILLLSAKVRQKVFFPNAAADPTRTEPLPPGSMGCPLIGRPFFLGSKRYGAGAWYVNAAKKLGNPRIWKYYFMGYPMAVISGGNELKTILNKEFDGVTTGGANLMDGGLMPMDSLLFEGDKLRHSFLRRLVGQSLTPANVAKAVPSLQRAADISVQNILALPPGEKIKMDMVCNDYTLDVAWRQILGLTLTDDEIPEFKNQVESWLTGMMTPRILLRIAVKSSPGYRAMMNVISKIEERIKYLESNGPDSSTLSGMLFAKDEEDPSRKLTRQELVDNSLILIFAGSETSSSTLTNAMLFLGLHPQSWNKLVDEQQMMIKKHGDTLTKQTLDDECPYLDAVIRETMRMRGVIGGIPRLATETIIVNGKQIPKGWMIDPSIILTHDNDPKTHSGGVSDFDPVSGFVPERWLDESTRPEEDFVPFGAGPRFCLGYNLAMVEMKVFLATLARNINFQLDRKENIQWKPSFGVMAKASDGVLVSIESKKVVA